MAAGTNQGDVLETLSRKVQYQLHACHGLIIAIDGAVGLLTEAGSNLQKHTAEVMFTETPAEVGPLLFSAINTLGEELVGLAATLTGYVVTPLQDMTRRIESELAKCQTQVDDLKQKNSACTVAFEDVKKQQEEASASLAEALQAVQQLEGEPSWRPGAKMFAENRLQRSAAAQSQVIEELARRTEEQMTVSMEEEEACQQLQLSMECVAPACAIVLATAMGHCSQAWDVFALLLRRSALEMRRSAEGLSGRIQETPKALAAAAAAREARAALIETGTSPIATSSASAPSTGGAQASKQQRPSAGVTPQPTQEPKSTAEDPSEADEPLRLELVNPTFLESATTSEPAPAAPSQKAASVVPVPSKSSGSAATGSRSEAPEVPQRGKGAGSSRQHSFGQDQDCSLGDTDQEAFRKKMEEKRLLAELHNGEDLTAQPQREQQKGNMPGFHPLFAEKLEERRRRLEAATEAPMKFEEQDGAPPDDLR